MKRVVITGATGLIGQHLVPELIKRGDEVYIVSRSEEKAKDVFPSAAGYIKWSLDNGSPDLRGNLQEALVGKDAVIHLAGRNLMAGRWTKKHKRKIYDSRIKSTKVLAEALEGLKDGPEVFVQASAVHFYGFDQDKEFRESDPPGEQFISKLVNDWEAASDSLEKSNIRRVSLRTGVVLEEKSLLIRMMKLQFRLFTGGPIGSGEQWFSWIHITDIINAYLYSLDNNEVSGPVNAVAPDPVTMKKFSDTFGKVIRRPSYLKIPTLFLRMVLGDGAEVAAKAPKVIPGYLLNENFKFKYPDIESALYSVLTGK